MQVIKMNAVVKETFESPLFTGPEVSRQVLLPDSKEFNVNIVNFGKGVRNKFHAHNSEQVLIVTSGQGYIATETEKNRNHCRRCSADPRRREALAWRGRGLRIFSHLRVATGKRIDSTGRLGVQLSKIRSIEHLFVIF